MPVPGPKCPYCKSDSILVDASSVYGPKYEGKFCLWICENYPDCDAYVGVTEGFPSPVGTLANAELRGLRRRLFKAIGGAINQCTKRTDRVRRRELENLRKLVGWQNEDQCRQLLAGFYDVQENEAEAGPWWMEQS